MADPKISMSMSFTQPCLICGDPVTYDVHPSSPMPNAVICKKHFKDTEKQEKVINSVMTELSNITSAHPPYNSAHEGYAILKEEVDELWDEVKNDKEPYRKARMYAEAKQVAAVAIKFLMDICEG